MARKSYCEKCGETHEDGNCKMAAASPAKGGKHEKQKGGRHRKPWQCTYTWNTRPEKNALPGAHYDHKCVNANRSQGSDGNQCGAPHACNNFLCHETHP